MPLGMHHSEGHYGGPIFRVIVSVFEMYVWFVCILFNA